MSEAVQRGEGAGKAGAGSRRVFIEGIALWGPQLPGWEAARAILRGEALPAPAPVPRPAPAVLPPNERRRATDSVAVALEVASGACESSGRPPRSLPSVFASTFGDTSVSDYLCSQLARAPLDTSPTKFHNSVHNAAAGYWAIATGCAAPYTAISAHRHTFGTGLALACTHVLADEAAVLYVAYDIETPGPLATVSASRGVLGAALVMAPEATPRARARLEWRVEEGEARATRPREANAALVEGNAMASCLALFEALADMLPGPADAAAAALPGRSPARADVLRREIVTTLASRLALRLVLTAES